MGVSPGQKRSVRNKEITLLRGDRKDGFLQSYIQKYFSGACNIECWSHTTKKCRHYLKPPFWTRCDHGYVFIHRDYA